MRLFQRQRDIRKLSDEELSNEYKSLSKQYDKKRTEDLAKKMNEIGTEWDKREKKEIPQKRDEEPPLDVQKAIHDIAKPDQPAKPEPEKPMEIIPQEFVQQNGQVSQRWPVTTEPDEAIEGAEDRIDIELKRIKAEVEQKETEKREKKFKNSLKKEKSKVSMSGMFGKKPEKQYCIKCKHETKHHIRKNGKDEGCKLCGCLKTLSDIQNQEEKSVCGSCNNPVYIIEATMYEGKPYHHKCYEEYLWKQTKEDTNED